MALLTSTPPVDVTKINANGTILDIATIADTQFLRRSGTSIVSSVPELNYTNILSTTAFNTTSLTPVDIPGASATPNAGTYFILFTATTDQTNNNRLVTVGIYKNGTLISGTQRTQAHGNALSETVSTQTVEMLNGTDTIVIKANVDANTGSVLDRCLTLLRIA